MPIDGHKLTDGPCLFQILDINIHVSINQSINLSIYQRTDKMGGGIHQLESRQQYVFPNRSINGDMEDALIDR